MFKKTVSSITKQFEVMIKDLETLSQSLITKNNSIKLELEENERELLKATAVALKLKEIVNV